MRAEDIEIKDGKGLERAEEALFDAESNVALIIYGAGKRTEVRGS